MKLSDAFDPKAISWRAQSVSKKNPEAPKAMALAYIDARDVMERLDAVCGPEGWEDSYVETPLGRVICTIRIKIGGEWIAKSDGAGKTDIEGDKGGISDAFKRAAVKWGIGRYLYDMPTPWVACKLYNDKWSEWTPEGRKELDRIARGNAPAGEAMPVEAAPHVEVISDEQWSILASLIPEAKLDVKAICDGYKISSIKALPASKYQKLRERIDGIIRENGKVAA